MRAYTGLLKPKRITILGMDLAGEVKAVGKDITRFQKGDQVFATTGFTSMGTYAEFICLPEEPEDGALALKPSNMSYTESAALPTGCLEALSFVRQGNIQPEQQILINGASGTIGPFAVQLAKHFGAIVTAVDSTKKLDALRAIGVDHVIDFTHNDFTQNGRAYDLIIDLVGQHSPSDCMKSLTQNGRYLLVNPDPTQMIQRRWASTRNNKMILGFAHPNTDDLVFIKHLAEAGKIKPVIDRIYPLEQTAEAHAYVETGHKTGNVVITLD